eukprot:TRINITY_DN25916_c0_g1_i1.p1 TRINITY_DN25916_c0_g1~~TRINITY_DN25916_c0_g1_i1.p1  ORF type:complete len:549 (+),score=128.72 TRINITY_DN25916_c0_g1_i1:88-1734(+)
MPLKKSEAAALSPDDDLEELQKKFHLLEGDRKAYYETSQCTIRENKDILASVKAQNQQLQQALASIKQETATRGQSHAVHIQKLEGHVFDLRKRLDETRNIRRNHKSEFEKLEGTLRLLEKQQITPALDNSPQAKYLRSLENRFDKATIKFNEAQSIRKTYVQIVKRLREERVTYDNRIRAIERTLEAKNRDFEELQSMSSSARQANEQAKTEWQRLDAAFSRERELRERELTERRHQVLARERARTTHTVEREMEGGEESGTTDRRALKSATSERSGPVPNKSTIEEEERKITTYEEAFRKIKDATGVSDVNEVIEKFLTQENTRSNLTTMLDEVSAQLDDVNEEKAQVTTEIENVKFAGVGGGGSRRIIDELEAKLTEVCAKTERARQKHERLSKILTNVKAGIQHLADRLDSVKLNGTETTLGKVTDHTVVNILHDCEQRLGRCLSAMGEETKFSARSQSKKDLGHDKIPNNVRIDLKENADDLLYVDTDAVGIVEEGEEVVLDRDTLKRQAMAIMDKANRKTTKKKLRRGKHMHTVTRTPHYAS